MQESEFNCAQIPRRKFVNEVSVDVVKALGMDYDIPPLFETEVFAHAFKKHYSLGTNDRLRCRWREYVQGIEFRKFTPFELPDARELHFYNHAIRFLPSESTRNRDQRFKLKPGPGVDFYGQMPIPQEALMKRGTSVKSDKPSPTVKPNKDKPVDKRKEVEHNTAKSDKVV